MTVKTAKHTPAPWTVYAVTTGPEVGAIYVRGDGGSVAKITSVLITRDEDAHLIAAAPELLAALSGLNHRGGDDQGGYCICPRKNGNAPNAEHSTGCANARAAIAKAVGRE